MCDFVANLTLKFGIFSTFFHYHPPGYNKVSIVFIGLQCCFIPVFLFFLLCHTNWLSILVINTVLYLCFYCVIHTDHQYWSLILFYTCVLNCVIHTIVTYYFTYTIIIHTWAFTLLLLCLLWVCLRPLLAQFWHRS